MARHVLTGMYACDHFNLYLSDVSFDNNAVNLLVCVWH